MPNNKYPEIKFVDTDTETLVNKLITSYEKITGRTLYPADPARLFILWIADVIIQEREIINESAKQNVPRYAEGEYLDSLEAVPAIHPWRCCRKRCRPPAEPPALP